MSTRGRREHYVEEELHLGPVPIDVSAWVYGTVTIMSVLVVYEGWEDRKRLIGLVLVVVGPALALALARLFADVLDHHVSTQGPISRADLLPLLGHAGQYLLVTVPLMVVLVVTALLPSVDLRGSVQAMLWFALLSLGFWGWLAGRRAGMTGWRLAASAGAGLLVGLVVIGLQILLKPH